MDRLVDRVEAAETVEINADRAVDRAVETAMRGGSADAATNGRSAQPGLEEVLRARAVADVTVMLRQRSVRRATDRYVEHADAWVRELRTSPTLTSAACVPTRADRRDV